MAATRNGLCGLGIGNFKAFGHTQRFPIRPLTFIYGANSVGKSSIIHSLLLVRHALENGNLDVHKTKLGGESLDLGGFRQHVYKHATSKTFDGRLSFSPAHPRPIAQAQADSSSK